MNIKRGSEYAPVITAKAPGQISLKAVKLASFTAFRLICPGAFAVITGAYSLPRLIFINATPCHLLNVVCSTADLLEIVKISGLRL